MFNRAASEGLEPERLLLGKRSLETSPPELRQALTYVLRLRSCWKPEGRAKLVVPASWTAFLPFADGKCGATCALDRNCPSRHVRFKTRPVAPAEDVPHDMVSQLLTNVGMEDSLARFVSRAFEGMPRTRMKSDVPVKSRKSTRRVDFALVPEHASGDTPLEKSTRHLLFGIKEPHAASDFEPLPEELIGYGRFHLTLLASLAQRVTRTLSGPFPEWLVLFGLVYDACRLRIVAYVPRRHKSGEIDCASYVVDELAFRSSVTDANGCELVLERLRFLLALRTLRRHVHHLCKSLFTPIGPCDGIRRISGHSLFLGCSACDQDDLSDSGLGSSQHCSSKYSTCPSGVHTRGMSDSECGLLSHSGSFSSSCCSTCLSVLESASSSDSVYSQESKYMEPSTLSLYQGQDKSINYPCGPTETRRREIIAWRQQVIPTEHPVQDNYRMVISHPHPRGQRAGESTSRTHS